MEESRESVGPHFRQVIFVYNPPYVRISNAAMCIRKSQARGTYWQTSYEMMKSQEKNLVSQTDPPHAMYTQFIRLADPYVHAYIVDTWSLQPVQSCKEAAIINRYASRATHQEIIESRCNRSWKPLSYQYLDPEVPWRGFAFIKSWVSWGRSKLKNYSES